MDVSPRLRRLKSLVGDQGLRLISDATWTASVPPEEKDKIERAINEVKNCNFESVNIRRGKSTVKDAEIAFSLVQYPRDVLGLMTIGRRSDKELAIREVLFALAFVVNIANATDESGKKLDRPALERLALSTLASAEADFDLVFG